MIDIGEWSICRSGRLEGFYCVYKNKFNLYIGVAIIERLLSDEKMARSLNDLSKSAQRSPRSLNDLSTIIQ